MTNRITKYLEQDTSTEQAAEPRGFVRCPLPMPPGISPQQLMMQQQIYQKAFEDAQRQALERDLFGDL